MNVAPLLERPLRAILLKDWWCRPAFLRLLALGGFSAVLGLFTNRPVTSNDVLHLAVPFCLASALLGHTSRPDILNEEQRAGTISLLFLARIKPLDLIVARCLAALATGWPGGLGVAPWLVLGLATRLDRWTVVGRIFLAWLVLFWLAAAFSLFSASLGRHRKKAVSGFLGSWWVLFQFSPMLATAFRKAGLPTPLIKLLELGNPAAILQAFWSAGDVTVPPGFYPPLGLFASVSLSLTLGALAVLRRKWGAGFAGESRIQNLGRRLGRLPARKPLRDRSPIAWLSDDGSHRLLWLISLASLSVMWVQRPASLDALVVWTNTVRGVLLASVCLLTFRSPERDWRDGSFDMIYATGLSDSELRAGYRRTAWRQVAGPLLVVTLANALWPLPPGAPTMSGDNLAFWIGREAITTWLGGWVALEFTVDTILCPKQKDASRWQFGLFLGGTVGFLSALVHDSPIGVACLILGGVAGLLWLKHRRRCDRLRELWRNRPADLEKYP